MLTVKLYFHTGSSNHGCEAIVRGTNQIINKNTELWSFAPEEDVKYGIDKISNIKNDEELVISKYSLKYLLIAIEIKLFGTTLLNTFFNRYSFFKKVKKGDIYLSIGGDNYTYSGIWLLKNYNKLLHLKKAKTVLWGCSIDENIIPEIKNDLSRYNLIIARESMTYNALLKEGIATEIKLCPDPAFQLMEERVELPGFFNNQKVIGINLSPLILDYGNKKIILENFDTLFEYLINETDYTIALIPHVVNPNNNDFDILYKYYKKYKYTNRIFLIDDLSSTILKWYISNCKFFLGARTHSVIAAYSSQVPTIAIGYSMKAKGIAKDVFGTFDNYVCSVQEFTTKDELIKSFKWLEKNEKKIIKHYNTVMPKYKKSALQAAMFLNNIIDEQ